MASKKAITATYSIFSNETYNNATLYVPVGSKSDFEKAIPWKLFYIQEKDYAGIQDIVADDNSDEQIEYFNLNGVRVENPLNGIFIRRQGNKVEKVIVNQLKLTPIFIKLGLRSEFVCLAVVLSVSGFSG